MPLPFVLAGAAAATVGFGFKKACDGYGKKSEATKMVKNATQQFDFQKRDFENKNKETTKLLDSLGKLQLKIGNDFHEFRNIADDLLAKIEKSENKEIKVNLPEYKLNKIADLSISATTYLGQLGGGAAAGAAAAYAVYGGVMAFAAASTGTPIAALSGVAAYNATLAAIGGGSLAAGGFGMAGGAMVLGFTVAAPIFAIAGWGFDKYAEKAQREASEYQREVIDAMDKMKISIRALNETIAYVKYLSSELERIYQEFYKYFEQIKAISVLIKNGVLSFDSLNEYVLITIDNGYQMAAILTDIITIPLFKVKKDISGAAIIKDDTPEMELDQNGLQVLNNEEINYYLRKGKTEEIEKVIR
ncbi:chemotaxis protein [Mesocricetibacter intestinalis]|uniref:chemotaxis protein n=1 Tax=Mesocricetibacter intestinalis TaxID=1521930 RepID=UPI00105E5D6B|nr:chemotaxis protein [Mesocricetibacter intestinalis]